MEERAYGLSRERGAGSPEDDWLSAEREVDEWLQARSQRLEELGGAANISATHVDVSFLTFMFSWTFVALTGSNPKAQEQGPVERRPGRVCGDRRDELGRRK